MQTEEQLNSFACNETSLAQSGKVCNGKDFCKCLHRIRVNVNDVVDFVIFDEGIFIIDLFKKANFIVLCASQGIDLMQITHSICTATHSM
jgi:hypothetical protein